MRDTSRRAAILEVASRLFAEKGYGRTKTLEIAQDAGVAEGTLYHHFGSKDGIFLTIFDEIVDGYLAGIESRVRKEETGGEALRSMIRFHFDYLERNAARFLVILRDFPDHLAREHAARAAGSRKKFGRLTDLLTTVLSRGVEDGSLRLDFPVRDTAGLLRGILYGTTRHVMLGIIDVPLSRLAKAVEGFCLRSLLSPAGRGSRRKGGRQ